MAFFEFMTGGVLLAPVNITNLVLQNSYIVIMALGMLLIIVGGNIDLSVGSIVGFVGAIAATMMVDYKMPWVPRGRASRCCSAPRSARRRASSSPSPASRPSSSRSAAC